MSTHESYVCPVCGRESFNANDVRERWCGNCHGLTSDEPPEGFAWVQFVDDGPGVLFGRMMQTGYIELGSTYDVVVEPDGSKFRYDGARFVVIEADA